MREPDGGDADGAMNTINSLLNHHQISSLQETSSHFDPSSSHEDFLEQMLSSVPSSSAASFPWSDLHTPPHFEDQSPSKPRQHMIGNGAAKALMLHQQMLLSRGTLPVPHADQNDVVDGSSLNSANLGNDTSVKALLNGFSGSSTQPHYFNQSQGGELQQSHNFVATAAAGGGGAAEQPRQKVRARRGQATDPHSIAERLRRERIAERMKALQELVPNANKTDKASMLDEIIDYVKFLQLQVKVLSMSRLGGAAAVAPLVAGISSAEGRSTNGTKTASSSETNNGMSAATEQQVLKLMEEDMGSAMQYLQGKGLCLMPISLATAISTATCRPRNPLNHPIFNGGGEAGGGGPPSPSLSALTAQSAATGEASVKDSSSPSKLD